MTAPANRLLDVGEIARLLDARVDSVVLQLLPDGGRRGHEWVAHCPWRAHKKLGAFSVHLTGEKAGVWSEFSAGESGDTLDLVARTLFGGDKRLAIQWALHFLGLAEADAEAVAKARRAVPAPGARDPRAEAEAETKRKSALAMWAYGGKKEVLGTAVDRYLAGRAIPLAELGGVPAAIRFHPALWNAESKREWPAMVTAITAPNGQFAACHRTWLDVRRDGSVTKAPLENAKMTLGSWRGCAIRLWKGAEGRSWKDFAEGEIWNIAEGIENALSVALAWPECRALSAVALPNLPSIALPPAIRAIRLWHDTDEQEGARALFTRAVAAHQAAGRTVFSVEMPAGVKDANDILKASA